jgi:regulatory protein
VADVAEAIERDAAALRTYDRALDILASRAHSSSELRRRLLRKGGLAEHVDAAIARLQSAGYLDDAGFARQFARAKIAGAGFAKRRLEQELYRRGVARDVARDAIAEVLADDTVDATGTIGRLAQKKMRSRARRLYAFLTRRGYGTEEIRHAIMAAEQAQRLDDEDRSAELFDAIEDP